MTTDHLFDSEIGYWDTELSLAGSYPDAILNRSIPERMVREYPAYLDGYLAELRARFGQTPQVLDVGSGPLSMLAYGHRTGVINLTAADPLAATYRSLLEKHGREPNCSLIECAGEHLSDRFGFDAFDLVWIHNALDHSQEPALVFRQMVTVVRPGGYLVVQGWTREGTSEHWAGLHKHDLYLTEDRRLMCETFGHELAICLSEDLPIEVVESSQPTIEPKKWLRLIARKRQ